MTRTWQTYFQEANPEVWVQLGEEPHNTNTTILDTVLELKEEMARLHAYNERLMQEQEKIMKCLSDRQNQRQPIPIPKHGNMTGEQEFWTKCLGMEGGEENQEEKYDNASEH